MLQAIAVRRAVAVRQALASPTFVGAFLAFSLAVGLFAFARRHRDAGAARWFTYWLAANCVWIGTHTVGLLVYDPSVRLVFDAVELATVPVAATLWFLFTLAYGGWWTGERLGALAVVPVLTAVASLVVVTSPLHGLVIEQSAIVVVDGVSITSEAAVSPGAIWLLLGYVFLQYATGLVVVLDLIASTNRLYTDQIVALVSAVAVPLVVAAGAMSGVLPVVVDPTPMSFGFSAVPLTYAVFRSELLDLFPASYRVGERTALETLDQGVLVLDHRDRVAFANDSAASILDADDALLGRRLRCVLAASPLEAGDNWTADAGATGSVGRGAGDVESIPEALRDVRTGRTYRVYTSGGADGDQRRGGRTLFLDDVTEARRRKQRLLVLNRIVRHNLRNDLTVLRGHVDVLAEQVDHDSVPIVEGIAADVQRLGEKTHEMDRMIREAEVEAEAVNVASLVDRVAARMEGETGATVEVWGDVQAWTRTQPEVVESIVRNLVEIAAVRRRGEPGAGGRRGARSSRADPASTVRAGPSRGRSVTTDGGAGATAPAPAAPTVVVTVTAEDDAVRLTVEDDGPPIPEDELRGLLDGEVSVLQHGASIGLWVVKWCVDLADASWSVETGAWTRVSVTFPSESDLQTSATGLRDGTE